jgi:hypothetical protein
MAIKQSSFNGPSLSLDSITSNINSLITEHANSVKDPDSKTGGVSQLDEFFKNVGEPAPNIIEWATRPEYLNFMIEDEDTDEVRTVYNHHGQYQTLRDFFELLCPICSTPKDLDCKEKSRETLGAQTLLVWNPEYRDDECPRCKTTRKEFIESKLFRNFNTMLLIIGMRSSKSTTAAIIASFLEHRLLLAKSPQKLFGQSPSQQFEIGFVATTAKQAEKTIYEAYRGLRDNCTWLQSYIKKLRDIETFKNQYYEDKSKSSVKYKHIRVNFESFSSNSAGIAGATRIACFIDELSRFDDTGSGSKKSANEVYSVFSRSLKTIRATRLIKTIPNCFGIQVSTTSPISATDYAMNLGKKSEIVKNIYFVHKPTWEFNPYQPRENFQEDYDLDPIGAERDFGANPPLAQSPFVQDVDSFNRAIDINLKPTATFIPVYSTDPKGGNYVGKQVEFCVLDRNSKKVIFGDAGAVKDSFCLVGAHGEWRNTVVEGKPVPIWATIYDFAMAVNPTANPKRIVSFGCITKIIKDINVKQNVMAVRFDHWNSESIIQDLNFSKIDAGQFKLTIDNYMAFIQDVYTGKVLFLPPLESDVGKNPYTEMSDQGRLIHELLHLNRSENLKKIDHAAGEHNDLACCAVGAHYLVQNELPKIMGGGVGQGQSEMGPNSWAGGLGKFRRW